MAIYSAWCRFEIKTFLDVIFTSKFTFCLTAITMLGTKVTIYKTLVRLRIKRVSRVKTSIHNGEGFEGARRDRQLAGCFEAWLSSKSNFMQNYLSYFNVLRCRTYDSAESCSFCIWTMPLAIPWTKRRTSYGEKYPRFSRQNHKSPYSPTSTHLTVTHEALQKAHTVTTKLSAVLWYKETID